MYHTWDVSTASFIPTQSLPHSKPAMSFEELLMEAARVLSSFPIRGSQKRIRNQHVKSFAFDLCLVAGGIR